MKYQQFIYKAYTFDAATKILRLNYSYDDGIQFTETFYFDFDFVAYDAQALDIALQQLFFMAGVSYYKAYLAPEICVEAGHIDANLKTFLDITYQQGLGEFFYINHLDPKTAVTFPITASPSSLPMDTTGTGLLVGIGGGKDSLVSIEMLRNSKLDIATWSLNHRPQLTPLIDKIGLKHYWVEREWDQQLTDLNKQGAYNGHVPISAIFACVGTVVAVLSGRRDHVVSNEQSANEPTLSYNGTLINHQYSKSQAFEQSYQQLLHGVYGDTVRYYSFLRPLSEVRIAELFSIVGFEKYHAVFSSCNRAFIHGSTHLFWDGTCPKCAFIFLAFTPFVKRAPLESLFHGKNLLLDPTLQTTYMQLLGLGGDKPLDCVGEIKESRVAMHTAQTIYPQLADMYQFDLPGSYDYKSLAEDEMPPEIKSVFINGLHQVNSRLNSA